MIEGPIGGAAFNNEFGRPNICGYFRSFEQAAAGDAANRTRGYHKPIMIAGGLGNVRRNHVEKCEIPVGAKVVVLGGPAMLIGLGGGAASSMGSGASSADLDFASVQRGNPEIQRRAQEVIDRCSARWSLNPILLIHDVGAGGLSNAVPEAVAHTPGRGAVIDLDAIPNDEPGMSPMELWCNESQERYVLIVDAGKLDDFATIARRERCPFAVIGEIDGSGVLVLEDRKNGTRPVDMPLEVLLGKAPKMLRDVRSLAPPQAPLATCGHRPARGRVPAAALSRGGRQDLPDLHRRSHRGRHDQPRPDGGAVAGAGGRRRRHPLRLLRTHRRSHGHGRAHAGGGAGCAGLRPACGGRGPDQHSRGRHRLAVERASCRPTGWRPAASRARTPRCTPRCTPWARSCVRRSASPFRWARTRCP